MSKSIPLLISYEAGHTYLEPWVRANFFCMTCGDQTVWKQDEGCGDWDRGELHMCSACGYSWEMPTGPRSVENGQDEQRLEALKAQDSRNG